MKNEATTDGRYQRTEGAYSLTVVLHAQYPCCKARAIFRATKHVPREEYSRKCKACGWSFDCERRTIRDGDAQRMDAITWTYGERA